MTRRLVIAIVCASAMLASEVDAQSHFDSRLQAAIDLAQSGRADSARALVRGLLATLSPQDSVYPQALYVQGGMLASDATTAATSLQRVVVEYGASPWADDALLRLSQLYEAQNDPAAAIQQVERLRRDYPESPLLPRTEFVGARAAFDLRDATRACTYVRDAQAGAGDDVELSNQVAFYAARCQPVAGAAPAPDTTRTQGPTRYAVQVLAGKSVPEVDALLSRLKALGYDARVVRDTSGYLKVRVGRYASRDEAQRVLGRLKSQVGGQPFIVAEP
jgi:cell division septation protein DedD